MAQWNHRSMEDYNLILNMCVVYYGGQKHLNITDPENNPLNFGNFLWNIFHVVEPLNFKLVQHTDTPRYSRTFICEFAYLHRKEIVQNANFPVKNGLFNLWIQDSGSKMMEGIYRE